MGKKRKAQQQDYQVVVEESREPAAYTISGQQQQQYEHDEQQQYHHQEHHAGGYDDDYGDADAPPSHYYQTAEGFQGGSRIDPDTLAYLGEVCEALSGVSDPDEAQLLRGNVLEEISGKELQLATDAASSTLLEQLLCGAPASQLMQFMSAFTDGELLWRLAGGAFGSHVAEKVLVWLHAAATTAASTGAADGDAAASLDLDALTSLLDQLVAGVEPHIVDYATDRHATHVVRALLVVLAGRDVLTPPGKKQRQRLSQQQQQQATGGGDGEEGQQQGAGGQQQQQQQHKGVYGRQRSSLAEKIEGSSATTGQSARFPVLLRRLVKSLPLFDNQQMASLGKNTYGGPLLQAMLRAAAQDESLLMLLLPPILGLDPSKAAAAAPGQRLATLTDSHMGRLLRDDCYSHLLEVAVAVMPQGGSSAAAAATATAGQGQQGLAEEDEAVQGLEGEKQRKKKRKVKEEGVGKDCGDEEDTTAAAAAAAAVSRGGGGGASSLSDEFYERFLRGRLLPLCCHHCANFVIQAALSATNNKNRVSAYVSELTPHLADLLKRRRSGVVAALAAAAARAGPGPHQQGLVTALAAALGQLAQWQGRTGTAHLAPALMTLDTQAVLGSSSGSGSAGSTTRLSTPGCAMLALLLGQFPPDVVAPFWESVGALGRVDVLRVAKDPSGSRMLEAALTTPLATGEATLSKKKLRKLKKRKQQQQQGTEDDTTAAAGGDGEQEAAAAAVAARQSLMSALEGSWRSIVQVPAGSFLLEAVYNSLPSDQAEVLVADVAASHDQLMSRCSWGPLVAKKLGLEVYLRSPEEWRKRAAAAATARKEFQQMLAGAGKHTHSAAAPAAAAPAATDTEAWLQDGSKGAKKRRREQQQEQQEEGEGQAVAAAANGIDAAADVAVSNAKKRARLAAAALAAAEEAAAAAAGGDDDAAVGKDSSSNKKKEKKKRKRQQMEQQPSAAAAENDAAVASSKDPQKSGGDKPPKKKSKKSEQQQQQQDTAGGAGGAGGAKAGSKSKRKRDSDSGGSAGRSTGMAAAAVGGGAGGGGGGVDLVALLGFGGLSAEHGHSSKKHKK